MYAESENRKGTGFRINRKQWSPKNEGGARGI
jgi:hypothetical protein